MKASRGIEINKESKPEVDCISRKEALKKAGKYAAFTAGAMMFFFSPKKAQAYSNPDDPGGGWGT